MVMWGDIVISMNRYINKVFKYFTCNNDGDISGDYSEPLKQDGWSKHYNIDILDDVVSAVETGNVSVWTRELLNICPKDANVLEIGCGTGISSLWLAKSGRHVTAIDYTKSSVELVTEAAKRLNLDNIKVVHCDATKDLPFKEKTFDYIFQAGLLEHFTNEEQISLLARWSEYGKNMISMIPNAASLPYRIGKCIMESNGTWEYGLEIPKHSFKKEFTLAGISVEKEYTIGTEWALSFLPPKHWLKNKYRCLLNDGYDLDEFMQGYLLVTIGKCK